MARATNRKPSILICVLRKPQPEVLKEVKRFGDVDQGICTQVVLGEKLKPRGLNQYWYDWRFARNGRD